MREAHPTRDQSKHNLAIEVLRRSGSLRLTAFGYSMLPTLFPGDILTVKAESLPAIQTGDVVLFTRQGRFFIHRTLRRMQAGPATMLLTRGDSLPHPEEPVSAEELLGRIVSVERGEGAPTPVPRCSPARRFIGLLLAYSGSLRSHALRWHERTLQSALARHDYISGEASPK
jgi:Peptidase S24-like